MLWNALNIRKDALGAEYFVSKQDLIFKCRFQVFFDDRLYGLHELFRSLLFYFAKCVIELLGLQVKFYTFILEIGLH